MENVYIVSISFNSSTKEYFFSTSDKNTKVGDLVVVETSIGKEVGTVKSVPKPIETFKFDKEIKPILRKATAGDIKIYNENIELAKNAGIIFINISNKLKLNMRLISSEYTLDRTKILFTYAADERIDFREFLKNLAAELHCRIELRQISSRERAQLIGGIGVCGLPICCTTFFKTFDGISLNRAKNQMLTINIPKLSGLCNKLKCCLKYEDDQYTKLKEKFPPMNSEVTYQNMKYKVTGFNVFSNIVKIETQDNIEYVALKDLKFIRKNDKK